MCKKLRHAFNQVLPLNLRSHFVFETHPVITDILDPIKVWYLIAPGVYTGTFTIPQSENTFLFPLCHLILHVPSLLNCITGFAITCR